MFLFPSSAISAAVVRVLPTPIWNPRIDGLRQDSLY